MSIQPSIVDFLSELRTRHIQLWVEDQQLRYSAPKHALTPDLRAELVRRKAEILAFFHTAQTTTVTAPRLQPVAHGDLVPLSFAQQRLWLLDQLTPGSTAYLMPALVQLRGALNLPVFARSLNAIVERHAVLRTTFGLVAGEPCQQIGPHQPFVVPVIDLQPLSAAERVVAVERQALLESTQPFDLQQGPLIRARLLRVAAEEHLLLLTLHHIISDGWSLGVLLRELAALYGADGDAAALPALPVQYADYTLWQRDWLQGDVHEQQLAFWRETLAGAPETLALPTDHPRPPVQSFRGAAYHFRLPATLTADLHALSRRADATLFMTLLTAWSTLLARLSGQWDLTVGTPIANRTQAALEPLIGFFVNTLVLRTDLSGNPSFLDALARVRATTLAAYAHQDLPFEHVVEAVQPQRSLSSSPLFQVLFALQNAPLPALRLSDITLTVQDPPQTTAKFDLSLALTETEQEIAATLEYATDLFDAATIARLAQHFGTLLDAICADPQQPLASLPLLTAAERTQLLTRWNQPALPAPEAACLHDLVAAQAQRTPDHTALVGGDQALSYATLNARANQLAHELQTHGVGPEVRVGVYLPRTADLVVALLAVLKAGGAYVPLDPAYPAERLQFMLQDTQAPVILTDRQHHALLPAHTAHTICLDAEWPRIAQHPSCDPVTTVQPNNLAYLIYTSGSTGRPKGVAIAHASAVALLHWAHHTFAAADLAYVAAGTSICFDLSIFELFVPLSCGGTVQLLANALEIPALAATPVTLLNTVPSVIAEVLRSGALPPSVRVINLAGEPLSRALTDALYAAAPRARVYNLYGPSEDTTYSTGTLVPADDPRAPTIGRPIDHTQAYILDATLQPVPIGVVGELYLGGAGLARGYLHRPALTAETFIPDPFAATRGGRLYKTGDLARSLPDGTIMFLGRSDHQVKVRGFRIELGEIEAALRQHPAVSEAVVSVLNERSEARLVAYVVENREPRTENQEADEDGSRFLVLGSPLRAFLRERLPEYMIPSLVVPLETIPLTPSGKIDRKALPAPGTARLTSAEAFVAPRTPVEQQLAAIWAEVLGLEQVGIHDGFFELGGDSIRSIPVITKANHAGIPIAPKHLFSHPTIAQLAALVGDLPAAAAAAPLPLTPAQRWLVEQQPAALDTQYQVLRVTVQRRLEPALVDTAVRQLVTLHEALRLRVWHDDTGWHQRIDPAPQPAPVAVIPAATAGDPIQLDAAIAEIGAQLRATTGDLLRVALVEPGAEQLPQLVLLTHPVAVDGTSEELLLNDLCALYDRLARGDVASVPPAASFKHWVEQLQGYAHGERLHQEHDIWRTAVPAHVAPLPVDRAADETPPLPRRVVERLTRDETAALTGAIATMYHAQLPELVVAALAQRVTAWSGTATLLLDLADESRDVPIDGLDLTRLAGCCTSVFPVALRVAGSTDASAALPGVKEQLRAVPHHGLGYGLLRAPEHDPLLAEELAQRPQAEVLFHYVPRHLAAPAAALVAARLDSAPDAGPWSDRYRLAIQAEIVEQQLQLSWRYNARCYQPATIARLAADVSAALRALIAHGPAQEAVSYTPADFPMANLGQRDLDKVLSKLRKAKGPHAR